MKARVECIGGFEDVKTISEVLKKISKPTDEQPVAWRRRRPRQTTSKEQQGAAERDTLSASW